MQQDINDPEVKSIIRSTTESITHTDGGIVKTTETITTQKEVHKTAHELLGESDQELSKLLNTTNEELSLFNKQKMASTFVPVGESSNTSHIIPTATLVSMGFTTTPAFAETKSTAIPTITNLPSTSLPVTNLPTITPTNIPTNLPTNIPTNIPTITSLPTITPTNIPTITPTTIPVTSLPATNNVRKYNNITGVKQPDGSYHFKINDYITRIENIDGSVVIDNYGCKIDLIKPDGSVGVRQPNGTMKYFKPVNQKTTDPLTNFASQLNISEVKDDCLLKMQIVNFKSPQDMILYETQNKQGFIHIDKNKTFESLDVRTQNALEALFSNVKDLPIIARHIIYSSENRELIGRVKWGFSTLFMIEVPQCSDSINIYPAERRYFYPSQLNNFINIYNKRLYQQLISIADDSEKNNITLDKLNNMFRIVQDNTGGCIEIYL